MRYNNNSITAETDPVANAAISDLLAGTTAANDTLVELAPLNSPIFKGTTLNDLPKYGPELLSESNWTSVNWTGGWAIGWTHTTGNTTALSNSLAAVIDKRYQIAYVVTNRTAGSFTITFGGATSLAITATGAFGPRVTSTANFVVTPTTDFNGTIVLSVKEISDISLSSLSIASSDAIVRHETRVNNVSNNIFSGIFAGQYNTTGINNTANGSNSLANNTTGSSNTANGANSLPNNTVSNANTAIGASALQLNTTGVGNTASGNLSLLSNTTGGSNAAYGFSSLLNNTTGSNNTAVGVSAGRFIADGATALTVCSNCVFDGTSTKASANSVTNENVFGYNAIGSGSNTVTIGSSAIIDNVLRTKLTIRFDAANSATFTVSSTGKLTIASAGTPSIQIGTASTNLISIYNATPVVRAAAITQTYSTATRTNPEALTSFGVSADSTLVDVTTATVADPAKINANFNDVAANIKAIQECLNAVIDDLQAFGINQ